MSSTEPAPGVVIVGASIAGATTAEALRAEGYEGRITLVGSERHTPYHRPPLSKQILSGAWALAESVIHDEDALLRLGVEFRGDETAEGLDLAARTVHTTRGSIAFDQLVIATGVHARRLPGTDGTAGVHHVRTIDDVLALRDRLVSGARVVVVGGGILGCEIAAAATKAGCAVDLVCRGSAPRITTSGDGLLPRRVSTLLRENGVRLRTHTGVVRVDEGGGGVRVQLADGSEVVADVVVGAIGCVPATGWLRGSVLDISDGVLCDASGRAAEGVFAVGDVARWLDGATGEASRVEHQLTAIEQAQSVARAIATGSASDPIVPFFWTELFGTRIMVYGTSDPDAPLTLLAGSFEEDKFLAASVRDGVTRALVAWNMPRELRQERARMTAAARAREPMGV